MFLFLLQRVIRNGCPEREPDNLFNMLHGLNIGAVMTDAAVVVCVHMELPTPRAFIRFAGRTAWIKLITNG